MKPIRGIRPIFAAAMMAAGGAAVFLLLPMLVGQMVELRGLNESQAGIVASSYFATYFLTGATAFVWISRVRWRAAGFLAYILMASGLLLAAGASGFYSLVLSLAVSGAGGGMLFALGVAVISATADADRNFGWVLVAQQSLAAILLLVIPAWIVAHWGFPGSFLFLTVAICVLGVSVVWVPASPVKEAVAGSFETANPTPVRLALLALVLHFTALSAIWAFVERLAAANDLDQVQIGNALALSMLGGLMGAFLVTWLADRVGRRIPLWVSALAFALICTGYATSFDWWGFVLLTGGLSFAWNFVLAYQMGIIAGLDSDGRHAVLMPAAQAGGAMLGPAIGGWLMLGGGHMLLLGSASLGVVLATGVFSRYCKV